MTESEIVLDRIRWVEAAKHSGDVFGRGPGGGFSIGKAQVSADAVHVGVDRNEQDGGRNGPEPEIDPVGGTYHPSRVEQQPLAGTARARITDEVPKTAVAPWAAKRVRKVRKGLSEVAIASGVKVLEGLAETAVPAEQSPRTAEQDGQMLATVDPMHKAIEASAKLRKPGLAHTLPRTIAQSVK